MVVAMEPIGALPLVYVFGDKVIDLDLVGVDKLDEFCEGSDRVIELSVFMLGRVRILLFFRAGFIGLFVLCVLYGFGRTHDDS